MRQTKIELNEAQKKNAKQWLKTLATKKYKQAVYPALRDDYERYDAIGVALDLTKTGEWKKEDNFPSGQGFEENIGYFLYFDKKDSSVVDCFQAMEQFYGVSENALDFYMNQFEVQNQTSFEYAIKFFKQYYGDALN